MGACEGKQVHPALARLTPSEARDLMGAPTALFEWLDRQGIAWSPAISAHLLERSAEPPTVAPSDPRRTDAAELLELVERAGQLPPRLGQIARLCLQEGLSLGACAARLGIRRATVKVHLRRLRALRRRAEARPQAIALADGFPDGASELRTLLSDNRTGGTS